MKAILVIDLGNADSDYYYIDYVVRRKETGNTLLSGYNVNLKPMPRKRGKVTLTERTQDIDNLKWQLECNIYSEGYNKCIDTILGEENE